MTETAIVALIGSIATLVGTLTGGIAATVLTNRHAKEQAAEARRFQLQDSAREIVVTILVSAREWHAAAMGASMVVATSDDPAELDQYLRHDFVDTYTGKQVRESGAVLRRAVTDAKLLISDAALRGAITELQTLHGEWWKATIDPPVELLKSGEVDKVERMRPWIRYSARFEYGLSAVERLAAEATASALTTSASRNVH